MNRVSVAEAGRHFTELIEQVTGQGMTIELERNDQIVARLSPVGRWLQASDLQRFFASLPSLGDDAESFSKDLERIRRELPLDRFRDRPTNADEFVRVPDLEVLPFRDSQGRA